jgi:hypothetical protein
MAQSILGALVTMICILNCPLHCFAIKIDIRHFSYCTKKHNRVQIFSTTLLLTCVLHWHYSYYGTRYADALKNVELLTAVAMESILKLVFF